MGYSFQPDLFDHEPSTLHEGRYRIAEALNHNPQAATMYRANHPCTRIWIQDIRGVPPEVVAAGRRIGLAWFSPDCTFHSKARGAAPIRKADQPIRDLPEVVIDWAKLERPRVIMLENVEEIVKWGPLDENGNRIKHLEGLYWDRWVAALRELGYVVEWRELRGCDYGAPTSRKRLFVIARCDGRPIVWPKPTHGISSLLNPYRTAADCIDWDLPVPSIFEKDKMPVEATCKRVARGVVKYVLENPNPFIIPLTHQSKGGVDNRQYPLSQPVRTITGAKRGELALIAPYFVPNYGENENQLARCSSVEDPFPTITPKGNGANLVAAWMVQHNTGATGHLCKEPLSTLTGAGTQQQLATANFISVFRRNSIGRDMTEPLGTVTCGGDRGGGHFARVAAFLQVYNGTYQNPELNGPMPTVVGNDRFCLVTVVIDGVTWILTDIGMRMLTARECYRAQGFLDTYVIDPLYKGKPLSKTAQMKCCGNSVNPQIAEALVAANVVLEDDEIVTDAFAGGGGATVGMLKGLNEPQEVFVRQRAA